MLILFVVALSLLALGAVMSLLAIAAGLERGQLRRLRHDSGAQPFMLSLCDAFDPEHAILWSSQLTALRLIASGDKRGVKYSCVYSVYQAAARHYPELYDGSSFAQWLLFLERSELIALTRFRVKITEHGRKLLQQCLQPTVAA